MGHKKVARLPFCTCPVILSGVSTLVYILRRVFEQLANSCAVTMLWYTGCNVVIVMAATAWLMMSFSSCIVCGFDLYTVLSKCPQRKFLPSSRGGGGEKFKKYGIRIKSAHDTGTEAQHQPRSCSHQNHYVTSGIPQHY